MLRFSYLFCLSILSTFFVDESFGQALRYDVKQGQAVSYEYDITIDHATSLTRLSGIVHYQVAMATDQHIRLQFEGGLRETSEPHPEKPQNGGTLIGRANPALAYFGRLNFPGKSHTRCPINLTRSGQVLTLDTSSQLPYLLGNLSLIPFEILSETEKKEWRTDSGVTISENIGGNRPLPRPFGPILASSERLQVASEVTHYTILDKQEGIVRIQKKYELKTPEIADRESLSLSGKGIWQFDTSDNLPFASDMEYQLVLKEGNTTTTLPIRLKFTKLSKERLAALEKEKRTRQEQAEKMIAEQKALAAAPITGEELDKLIIEIESGDMHRTIIATSKLMHKELTEADPRLIAAIRKLADSDEAIANLADNILKKIDPVYKINKMYEGTAFVESTGLRVDESTELFIGQIVQISENGQTWYPADITDLLSDGKVVTRYRGWGKRRAILARHQIQLAPKEVVQPKRESEGLAAKPASIPGENTNKLANASRTWSDGSGTFKVEASYLGLIDDKVVLKTADGREIQVAIARLSLADRKFIDQIQEELRKMGNPFEKQP